MNRKFIPLEFKRPSPEKRLQRANDFFQHCNTRRTVRDFSSEALPGGLLELLIPTANTAPSGANKQPWTFVVVNLEVKRSIRIAAEEEEIINYERRFTDEWLQDLFPLGTDWRKPFLEEASCLIVVFRQDYGWQDGKQTKHY
jgi:iodotyrosine deiodinase